jgi:hypothetical protein
MGAADDRRRVMPNQSATLVLDGEVTLSAFANAVRHFDGLVRTLSAQFGDEEIRWVVEALEASSALATVRPDAEPDVVVAILDAYLDVGRALARGEVALLARPVREQAIGIASVLNSEIPTLRFETPGAEVVISHIPESPRDLSGSFEPGQVSAAYGGVQGRVQTLSSRGNLRFTVYDTVYDRAVSCYLHEGQEEVMRDVWGRVAIIEGWVTRDPLTGRAQTVRNVRRVTVVDEAEPTAYLAARGLVHPSADTPLPEERIRALRDAEW